MEIDKEYFKQELKDWKQIDKDQGLSEQGKGRLEILEKYKNLILYGVSNQRELLIDFLDELKPSDYMELKFENIVDTYLKAKGNL